MKNLELRIQRGISGAPRKAAALLISHFSFLIFLGVLHAQAPVPPAAPKNLVPNGGFERVTTFQNLYDGVDASGNLRVPRANSPVYLEGSAQFTPIPFAASPCFVDVNSDGLPDLVVASPLGMLYWYPNIGKKGEPKFDHGRLVQTYLGPGARIDVADWNGDGRQDVLFGNVEGDVDILPNRGVGEPQWVQAMSKPRWMYDPAQKGFEALQAMAGPYPISVGTYSAPCYADWNKDGIPDLIVGEGAYSANSIRVWINTGSKSNPVFKDEMKFYIAFGDGREQLTPTVCDWNGDGIPDLLVGDREGHVTLYLGTAEAIKDSKKIEPVEFTKFITVGGRERVGSLISISTCDWNGDGIPDLIYGTTSGMVMVALGKGKREDPEFSDPPFPVKGVDFAKDFKQPSGWTSPALVGATESGIVMDMNAPMPEVVSVEENPNMDVKEGKRALHFSWFDKFSGVASRRWNWGWGWSRFPMSPSQIFKSMPDYVEALSMLRTTTLPFTLGKDHEFSFWCKGDSMKIIYEIAYWENVQKDPKKEPTYREHTDFFNTVSCGGSWNEYKKTFRLAGTKETVKEAGAVDTNGGKLDRGAFLTFWFTGTGNAWLDDVTLVEVTK